jgi:hypothetical protein
VVVQHLRVSVRTIGVLRGRLTGPVVSDAAIVPAGQLIFQILAHQVLVLQALALQLLVPWEKWRSAFRRRYAGRGPRIVLRAICHKSSHKWEQRRRLCVCDATAHVGVERVQCCSTDSLDELLIEPSLA